MVALRADYFGPKSFGTIMGISSLIVMLGMTAGPIAGGVLYDIYGNYELAFTSYCLLFAQRRLVFLVCQAPKLIRDAQALPS